MGNRKHLKVLEQGNQVYLETRLPRDTDFSVLQHVGVASERKEREQFRSVQEKKQTLHKENL